MMYVKKESKFLLLVKFYLFRCQSLNFALFYIYENLSGV